MTTNDFEVTVRHLECRWQQADKILLRPLFPLLASGKPVSPASFAEISGIKLDVLDHELEKGYVGRDFLGNIIELFGIMQPPSYHRIQIGDVCLFSCCALVAHMVPWRAQVVILNCAPPRPSQKTLSTGNRKGQN